MAKKITFENKSALQNDETIPEINKVTAEDMNEIKEVVNNNANELNGLDSSVAESIKNINIGQEAQDEEIGTLHKLSGRRISLSLDKNNYRLTAVLRNADDEKISESEIDLPLEDLEKEVEILSETVNSELEDGVATGESITVNDSARAKAKLDVGGNTKQNQYEGYNQFNSDSYPVSETKNGVTVTNNGDGSFTLNGTCTKENTAIVLGRNQVIQSLLAENSVSHTAYYVSGNCTKGTEGRTRNVLRLNYNHSYSFIPLEQLKEQKEILKEFEKTSRTDSWSWDIVLANGDTFDNFTIKYMLVKGTEELPYEPYVGGQASPNPEYPQEVQVVKGNNTIKISNNDNTEYQLLPLTLPEGMEMCSLRDLRDGFVKDLDTGKWYKNKTLAKYIFDGTESWTISAKGLFLLNNPSFPNSGTGSYIVPSYCSHFIAKSFNILYNGGVNGFAFSYVANQHRLCIRNDDFQNVDDFKNWLAEQYQNGNPVILYCPLIKPVQEEITDETLISQLDELYEVMTYYGQTNVTYEGDGLSPIFTLNYKKSNRILRSEIESIKARLDLLEN